MKNETTINIAYSSSIDKYKTRHIQQNPHMPKNQQYKVLTKEILDNIDFFKPHDILTPQTKFTNIIEIACCPNDCIYFLEKLKTLTVLKKKDKETYYYDHDDHGNHNNHDPNKELKREYISITTRKVETDYWCDIAIYGNLSKEIQKLLYYAKYSW